MGFWKSCYDFSFRYSNYEFESYPRTKKEKDAVGHLSPAVGGFLIWRKVLLIPCTVLLCLATILQAVLTALTYSSGGQTGFFVQMLGPEIWDNVFCPESAPRPCHIPGIAGVYYAVLITDVILVVISIVACVLLVIACLRWTDYPASLRALRSAYGAIFLAPFALLLLLPPAAFVDAAATQAALCATQLEQYMPDSSSGLTLTQDVCAQPIDQWQESLNASLTEAGRIRDRNTGTCPYAEAVLAQAAAAFLLSGAPCTDDNNAIADAGTQIRSCSQAKALGLCTSDVASWREQVQLACPAECGLCTVPPPAIVCEDHDNRFARLGYASAPASCADAVSLGQCNSPTEQVREFVREACPSGCGLCQEECVDNNVQIQLLQEPYASNLRNCRYATSAAFSPPLCTSNNATIRDFMRNACKASCGVCTPSAGRRRMQASTVMLEGALQGASGSRVGAAPTLTLHDGCVDPYIIQAAAVLEVTLSDQVIIGAFALRRTATVMLTLIPAALGLALGAGQGTTLAKALLPSSRLPARLAAIVVGLSLPQIASLLGVINQLIGSHFGTLACLSLLAMLAVWLPHGVAGKVRRLLAKAQKVDDAKADVAKAHPIIDPASGSAVVKAIGLRKWAVTFWLLLAVLFIALYLGLSAAYSLVTEQLNEAASQVTSSVARYQNTGQVGPLLRIVLTVFSILFSVIAKTYLAQAFYTDAGVSAVVAIWHTEKTDGAEVSQQRSTELSEVAEALNYAAEKRMMTEKPRARPADNANTASSTEGGNLEGKQTV